MKPIFFVIRNKKLFIVFLFLASISSRVLCAAEEPAPSDGIINYSQYGFFENRGTEQYRYRITNHEGLQGAAGEGVYPNQDYLDDPKFQVFSQTHSQDLDPWEFADDPEPKQSFYAWCLTRQIPEEQKLFFKAEALRRCGQWLQAINAYYAILIHFPKTVQWASDRSYYWYPALEAIGRIRKLCASHPELGLQLEGAIVDIEHGKDGNPQNDRVKTEPGYFLKRIPKAMPASAKPVQLRGAGKVRLVKYDNGDWQLLKDGKPFVIKGVTYSCTTVGESAHAQNLRPWMTLDDNRNGANDGMFDSWVDRNRNNVRDADEPVTGDAALLNQMGANAIRIYHGVDRGGNYDPGGYDKALMRRLANDFGVYFILGDFLGAYTVGSGADWNFGTDYTDPEQQRKMKEVVRSMVLDHKDEPYVLCWLLGNENQHRATRTNAADNPEVYAKFLNEVALMIHTIDPDHPVAVGNLGAAGLRELAANAPEIDIYGANCYFGKYSFGSLWSEVKRLYDRPVLITEFGTDALGKGDGQGENYQAAYLSANWDDIILNTAFEAGEGNAIGGIVFEWMDEWWKTTKGNSWGDPDKQNVEPDSIGPFAGGALHEEWLGIVSQGSGSGSPLLRQTRKVYEAIQNKWKA